MRHIGRCDHETRYVPPREIERSRAIACFEHTKPEPGQNRHKNARFGLMGMRKNGERTRVLFAFVPTYLAGTTEKLSISEHGDTNTAGRPRS